ncbi:MAG: hypothetical protein II609_04810, partial [Muribaculaceae bacterium]|nr:hypothetical protein [Muribaculaceae bacterium]
HNSLIVLLQRYDYLLTIYSRRHDRTCAGTYTPFWDKHGTNIRKYFQYSKEKGQKLTLLWLFWAVAIRY